MWILDAGNSFLVISYGSLAILLIAYLIGSIPFGLILTKLVGLGDVRKIGSGNIGATNVLRTGNKALAALTLLFDAVKGLAAVLFARYAFGPMASTAPDAQEVQMAFQAVQAACGLAAIVGHSYPIWLGFKGGKGVATFVGVTFGLSLWLGLLMGCTWLFVAFIYRISSLAALASLFAVTVAGFLLFYWQAGLIVLAFCLLILWRHRENLKRLLAGTEPKIGR